MASSCCLRRAITPKPVLHNTSNRYNPTIVSSSSSSSFIFKQNPFLSIPKLLVRVKNGGSRLIIHPPSASFSSSSSSELESQHHKSDAKPEEFDSPGMAQAFNISSGTASAICICLAFAALSFPLFMGSLTKAVGIKMKVLSYATLLFGFYMAWNVGANDVANAMGTSVGSGALTLRQAVLIAAILEFSGALLMGID